MGQDVVGKNFVGQDVTGAISLGQEVTGAGGSWAGHHEAELRGAERRLGNIPKAGGQWGRRFWLSHTGLFSILRSIFPFGPRSFGFKECQ